MNIESQLALVVKGVCDLLGAGCAGQAPGFGIYGIQLVAVLGNGKRIKAESRSTI